MAGLTQKDILVLIPAYNEGRHLYDLGKKVLDLGYPLLIVDDGSTDGTLEEAKNLGALLLENGANLGKGVSLRRGFERFLRSPYKAVVLLDADGQHEPSEIPFFLEALDRDGSDLVIGNRMHSPSGMPWVRRATNRFMSLLISGVARQRIPDTQCGFRLLKRGVLEVISLRSERFEIESEIILKAAGEGFRISSVPIRCVYGGETSQIRPVRDALRFFSFLLKYLLKWKKD